VGEFVTTADNGFKAKVKHSKVADAMGRPLNGGYNLYEFPDFILATQHRTASTSIANHVVSNGRRQHKRFKTMEDWKGKPIYGVIRDPWERCLSSLRAMRSKYFKEDLTVLTMLGRKWTDPHVYEQTRLHRKYDIQWMPFEEVLPMLGFHEQRINVDVSDAEQPKFFSDLFRKDYEAREAAISGLFKI
jgi:hypothetical protein